MPLGARKVKAKEDDGNDSYANGLKNNGYNREVFKNSKEDC